MELSSGAVITACYKNINGRRGTGRPKLTQKKMMEKDCHEWKLTTVGPQERSTWRSGVRSAMRAASQLPGQICRCFSKTFKNFRSKIVKI